MSSQPGKRQPTYSASYRADAVRLVEQSGKSVRAVAQDLGLSPESLRRWVQQARVDTSNAGDGHLTTAEREELRRLRREVQTLQMEREILKKAAAYFAKETL